MLERPGYQRYGLMANPFQDAASDNLDDVSLYHVEQEIDRSLERIKEEVLERRRRAMFAIVGPLGVGKTERLKVAMNEAQHVGAFYAYEQVSPGSEHPLVDVCRSIRGAADLTGWERFKGGPKWYRDLKAIESRLRKRVDPEEVGRAIAVALNSNAPAFLLLNDIQNLVGSERLQDFLRSMHSMANHLEPGVLVLFTCYPDAYRHIVSSDATFASRVDRTMELHGLSHKEAALLLAKRLPAKRIVEDLDPLYPFTEEAVRSLNEAAQGNPRRLLRLADEVLEAAVKRRAYLIDDETVQDALSGLPGPLPVDLPDKGVHLNGGATHADPEPVSAASTAPSGPAREGGKGAGRGGHR